MDGDAVQHQNGDEAAAAAPLHWFAHHVVPSVAVAGAVSGCFRVPGRVDVVVNHERWLELVESVPGGPHGARLRSSSWTPVFGGVAHLACLPWSARRPGRCGGAETHVRCHAGRASKQACMRLVWPQACANT